MRCKHRFCRATPVNLAGPQKVGKIMAFMAVIMVSGYLFYGSTLRFPHDGNFPKYFFCVATQRLLEARYRDHL